MPHWTPMQEIELQVRLERGESQVSIARTMGFSAHAVSNKACRLDLSPLKRRAGRRWTQQQDFCLRAWNKHGLCDTEIAHRLGFGVSTVGKRRRVLGLPSRGADGAYRALVRNRRARAV